MEFLPTFTGSSNTLKFVLNIVRCRKKIEFTKISQAVLSIRKAFSQNRIDLQQNIQKTPIARNDVTFRGGNMRQIMFIFSKKI